jgi:hypothetical protein
MNPSLLIAAILVASGIGIAFAMTRFKPIRSHPVVLTTVIINPGLVGLFAGAAFLAREYAPTLTTGLMIIAIGLIALSLPLVVIFAPRAIMEYLAKNQQPEPGESEPTNSDEPGSSAR